MTVYEGKPTELAKTLLLYQSDQVPEWHAYYFNSDLKFVDARVKIYSAFADWLEAFKERYITELMHAFDSGDSKRALEVLSELSSEVDLARDAMIVSASVDERQKIVAGVIVGAPK